MQLRNTSELGPREDKDQAEVTGAVKYHTVPMGT